MAAAPPAEPERGWPVSARIAARAAILLVALAGAIGVVRMGAATRLVRERPIAAATIAPGDARTAIAAALAAGGATRRVLAPDVVRRVGAALDRDVTDPTAIELRALEATRLGDHATEARLFALSNAISRRSLPTRLWLIQRSVERGDVAGALADFDIALRTSSDAPAVLFPTLARATADPALAAAIATMLDRPSDWRLAFLHYAIEQGDNPRGATTLLLHMRDRTTIAANQIDQALVRRLIADADFAAARQVQDIFHPAPANAGLVRDADFADARPIFPFGWNLVQQGELGAVRGHAAGKPALLYQALSGAAGQIATQLVTLPPGAWRLATRTATDQTDQSAPPFWTLTCAGDDGAQVALLDQPVRGGGIAAADFLVPQDCPAQWLVFSVRSSDATDGLSGAIGWVTIARR
jgi:hypothetical protein